MLNFWGTDVAAPAASYGQSFLLKFTNLCKIFYYPRNLTKLILFTKRITSLKRMYQIIRTHTDREPERRLSLPDSMASSFSVARVGISPSRTRNKRYRNTITSQPDHQSSRSLGVNRLCWMLWHVGFLGYMLHEGPWPPVGASALISDLSLTNSLATSSLCLWESIRSIVQPVSSILTRVPRGSQHAHEPWKRSTLS